MTGWRRLAAICGLTAVVVAAVVVALTVGLGWKGKPAAHPTPQPALPSSGPLAIPAPATGAYFGAWWTRPCTAGNTATSAR